MWNREWGFHKEVGVTQVHFLQRGIGTEENCSFHLPTDDPSDTWVMVSSNVYLEYVFILSFISLSVNGYRLSPTRTILGAKDTTVNKSKSVLSSDNK